MSAADVREPGWRPDLDDEGRRYAKPEFNDTLPEGWIPLEVRRGLMSVLTAYRAAEVVQAAWVGRCLNVEGATDVRIEQPERELVPFIGRFDEIVLFDDDVTPALMFPVAGGWVVGCDVDTVSTYLGCSAELAGKVLTCSGLEAVVARPEDPIG